MSELIPITSNLTPAEREEAIAHNRKVMDGWDERRMRRAGMLPPTRKNAHPERDLQNAVKEWLTLKKITFMELVVKPSTFMRGGRMVRVESPMRGWPDLILIVRGLFLGCELKVESVQSDAQKEAQKKIEAGGGVYRICRSVEDVEKLVNDASLK